MIINHQLLFFVGLENPHQIFIQEGKHTTHPHRKARAQQVEWRSSCTKTRRNRHLRPDPKRPGSPTTSKTNARGGCTLPLTGQPRQRGGLGESFTNVSLAMHFGPSYEPPKADMVVGEEEVGLAKSVRVDSKWMGWI